MLSTKVVCGSVNCLRILSSSVALVSRVMSASATSSTGFSVTYVTAPNETVAKVIAKKLVQQQLAACVNIVPGVTSIYMWQGEEQEDSEILMIIKSRSSRLEELTRFIKANHPYEVCEVISTDIIQGNPAYLSWLGESVPDVPVLKATERDKT